MLLDERLRALGARLFRWRSWTFLLAAGPLVLERGHFRYPLGSHGADTLFELGCLALASAGLALRALTIGVVPGGTSGRNTRRQKADALNTTGFYSVTRNPLYLGNALIFLGLSLLSQNWEIVAINAFLFAAAYVPITLVEERFLLERFGQEYRDYAARVPCWLPRPRLWRAPERPWSWRMVLRREHDTFFSTVLAFVVVEMVRASTVVGHLNLDPIWMGIGGAGALIWATLKILKQHTRVLRPIPAGGTPGAPAR